MDPERPKNIAEYTTWLKKDHNVEVSDRTERYYDAVVSKATSDFLAAPFWQALKSDLDQINQRYYLSTNYYLLGKCKDLRYS